MGNAGVDGIANDAGVEVAEQRFQLQGPWRLLRGDASF